MAEIESEILTVMLADIVGYTRKTSQLSREEFSNLHDAFDSIALPIFEKYDGNVIKKMGDAFLVTFRSPTNAVHCSTELQNAFAEYRYNTGNHLHIRVAVHTGEILHRHNDIYGDAVNQVSRIEAITPTDQIFFTEAVFSAMNKTEVPFQHLGLRKFRGIRYPVRLFRVRGQYGHKRCSTSSGILNMLLLIILLALLGAAVYAFITYVLPYL